MLIVKMSKTHMICRRFWTNPHAASEQNGNHTANNAGGLSARISPENIN